MKKVIFENGLKAFWAAALLLVLGVVSVQAQSSLTSTVATLPGVTNPPMPASPVGYPGLYAIPQGTFVGTIQAEALLDAELEAMKVILSQYVPGNTNDPNFTSLLVRYKYFGRVRDSLKAGANTATAITVGLWMFLESVEYSYVTPAVQAGLKQEVIDLLS